jgi:hypothetical protein
MENTKKSQTDWLGLARAWESSGISQRQFCKDHGLKLASFSYWRTQYLKSDVSGSDFVALRPEQEPCTVRLRMGGVELELAADADFVAEVLVKLSRQC